ncbi:hypothetical protein B0H14DRAFT_2565062 [Mycena olivaceomarginata]|nr:hypothetical protein B0H14DRAFT_2565062 [Mycena olivaceomarginata]
MPATLFLSSRSDTNTPCRRRRDILMEPEGEEADWEDEIRVGFVGDRLQFVHTTGLFSRRVRRCSCPDQDGIVTPFDVQLLQGQFYPATAERPSTAFTFGVLDEFAMDALECKTAGMTFLSKLRRLTDPIFPLSTPWRNLANLRRAGMVHDQTRKRSPGDLALFCVSCPQPGRNVSIEEVKTATNPKLYRPQVVADGNFKLDNLKMRILRTMLASQTCSNCNNHRAVNETNIKRKEVDSTGIGAYACARHGCFYPHSVVGFKVGEKQVNMDYAISEVFRQLPDEIKEFLLIYDISCQWHLLYREDLELTAAVGKFHLGAHILECFWEFSLYFMEGAGQVDGEILETLWASLDKVVGSTQSMSRAHRQEVLDDYMNDSNWMGTK